MMTMIHKKTFIVLLIIAFISNITYASNEPPLPPLPQSQSSLKEDIIEPKESFIQKIKNFFVSKKKTEVATNDTKVANNINSRADEENENEPFMDLGNKTLPSVSDSSPDTLKIPSIKEEVSSAPIDNVPPKPAVISASKPAPITTTPSPEDKDDLSNPPQFTAEMVATQKTNPHVGSDNSPALVVEKPIATVKNQSTPAPITILPQDEAKPNSQTFVAKQEYIQPVLSPEQLKFINDEARVLLLPNEDVILGQVTEEARISLMNEREYVLLLEKLHEQQDTMKIHDEILTFIHSYDETFDPKIDYTKEELEEIYISASDAIDKNNLFDLKALVDNYPILQTVNNEGFTLLHEASKEDNYSLAKFLIMRGININVADANNDTALEIAVQSNSSDIYNLLIRAGAK